MRILLRKNKIKLELTIILLVKSSSSLSKKVDFPMLKRMGNRLFLYYEMIKSILKSIVFKQKQHNCMICWLKFLINTC